jgi:hypothetical protein
MLVTSNIAKNTINQLLGINYAANNKNNFSIRIPNFVPKFGWLCYP